MAFKDLPWPCWSCTYSTRNQQSVWTVGGHLHSVLIMASSGLYLRASIIPYCNQWLPCNIKAINTYMYADDSTFLTSGAHLGCKMAWLKCRTLQRVGSQQVQFCWTYDSVSHIQLDTGTDRSYKIQERGVLWHPSGSVLVMGASHWQLVSYSIPVEAPYGIFVCATCPCPLLCHIPVHY